MPEIQIELSKREARLAQSCFQRARILRERADEAEEAGKALLTMIVQDANYPPTMTFTLSADATALVAEDGPRAAGDAGVPSVPREPVCGYGGLGE